MALLKHIKDDRDKNAAAYALTLLMRAAIRANVIAQANFINAS